ncbi:MAG: radical SAM protein [Planctomycetaceae bacterium]|jgi:radical SAM protein with 4Fe4S-binding SPASM domain|nr:radical SAM protein [Planctomycetaceae bacterium]
MTQLNKKQIYNKTFSTFYNSDYISILSGKYGNDFVQYREQFERSTQGDYVCDRPLYVLLGVNANCNLRCKMCPISSESKSKKEYLSLELIEKIADEVRKYEIPSVMIGADAECLLHPDIKTILKSLSHKNTGIIDFILISNGTLLTDSLAQYLIEIGLDRLTISLDAATPETYRMIRGANLNHVEENIDNFLRIRKKTGKSYPILRVSFVKQKDNFHEAEMFFNKWSNRADIIEIDNYVIYDPPVSDYGHFNHIKPFQCIQPFQKINIDYNGNMYPCAHRFNRTPELYEKLLLGNIKNCTIMDAWYGDKMIALRESLKNGENYPICQFCKAYLENPDCDFTSR